MTIASLFLALVVTSAADTSSGEPVLLDFHASWCGPCQKMRPEVKKLVQKSYPIRSIDIDRSPEIAQQYDVTRVPTFIVADSDGNVLARTEGLTPAPQLAKFYNDAKLKAADAAVETPRAHRVAQTSLDRSSDDPEVDEATESVAEAPANPRPWETVVRIKMHLSSKEWGFGSGTIIYSDAEQSIILTCAHIFRDKNGRQQKLETFQTPISVDLFDGKVFVTQKPATLRCEQKDIRGEAIDYDFTNDVGLIRIRPGRVLPASRVVPESWQPKRGLPMYSVGCSHGQDATAWNTRIIDPMVRMNSDTNKSFYEMKCEFQPSEGRSGGGLYTSDGYVAGVCDFADPNEHVGLYATPKAIHHILDRAKLAALYKEPAGGSGPMLAASGRGATRVRAQSPSDADSGSDSRPFTIPDPGMFRIPDPATRVASNRTPARPRQSSDDDDATRVARSDRRPERNSGEAIDPGAKPNLVLNTDSTQEPNSDSALVDLPEPAPARAESVPDRAPIRRPASSWKGVHTTRPRPAN